MPIKNKISGTIIVVYFMWYVFLFLPRARDSEASLGSEGEEPETSTRERKKERAAERGKEKKPRRRKPPVSLMDPYPIPNWHGILVNILN